MSFSFQTRSVCFPAGTFPIVAWRRGEAIELLVYGPLWLRAYDPSDGSERWSVPGLTDEPCTSPATGDGLVFVTSYNMKTSPEVLGLPEFSERVDILYESSFVAYFKAFSYHTTFFEPRPALRRSRSPSPSMSTVRRS